MKGWGFCGDHYSGYTTAGVAEECINLYPETVRVAHPQQPIVLVNAPGKRSFATATGTGLRAGYTQNGRAFMVSGTAFDEIASNGTVTNRGTVAQGTIPATMVGNGDRGNQILICSGGLGYVFNTSTNTFAAITDPLFPANCITVGFIDGYGIAVSADRFVLSASFDMTTWSTGTGQRTSAAGNLVGAVVDHKLLWLFGDQQTEIWYDSGAASFPLAPIQGVFIETGLAAPLAVTQAGESILWLTQDKFGRRSIVMNQGYDPVPVSTPAIEANLLDCADLSDFRAWTYALPGHVFAVFSSASNNLTLQYDLIEKAWSRLAKWNPTLGFWQADRGVGLIACFGELLVLDRETADVWALDLQTYADGDLPRRWLRQSAYISADNEAIFHSRFELLADMGVGLSTGQGSDPTVELSYSDDNAMTWSDSRPQSLGALGNANNRARWSRLGAARSRVYRLTGSDPVQTILLEAVVDVQKGRW